VPGRTARVPPAGAWCQPTARCYSGHPSPGVRRAAGRGRSGRAGAPGPRRGAALPSRPPVLADALIRRDFLARSINGCQGRAAAERTSQDSEEPLDAPAGSCLRLPRGGEHTCRVETEEARLLVFLLPAGLDGGYRELGQLTVDPDGAPGQGSDRVERLVATAARYGVEITGPGCEECPP
jgi:hypothetical protein